MKSVGCPLSQAAILTVPRGLSLTCQEVLACCASGAHIISALYSKNSLLSAILCVWKFFSKPRSDCLDTNHGLLFLQVADLRD